MAQITLYRDTDFQGAHKILDAAVPDLRSLGFNDETSSCRAHGYWMGYSDTNYQGHCAMLPPGEWGQISRLNMGNDKLSSLRPMPSDGIILFKDTGWRGDCVHVSETTSNLGAKGFNDATSSIMIMSGKWRLYQGNEFGGMSWLFEPKVYPVIYHSAGSAGIKNDSISSVQRL